MDYAVGVCVDAVFVNQGQCCSAGSRTYVQDTIYDDFVRKSVQLALRRKLGNPMSPDTDQGPQIDREQFDKILGLIESGKDEGASLECGGKRFGETGFFIEPTVFSQVKDHMRIAREEARLF